MKPCVIAALLIAAPFVQPADAAQPSESSRPRATARLRPATETVRAMVADAVERSATVRALAHEIAASDLIVYVEMGRPAPPAIATTALVTATPRARYVRITLDAMTPPNALVPLLAHELQHAVEIARNPDVRSSEDMRRLYARIGVDTREKMSFETTAALAAERRARAEGLAARNARRPSMR